MQSNTIPNQNAVWESKWQNGYLEEFTINLRISFHVTFTIFIVQKHNTHIYAFMQLAAHTGVPGCILEVFIVPILNCRRQTLFSKKKYIHM